MHTKLKPGGVLIVRTPLNSQVWSFESKFVMFNCAAATADKNADAGLINDRGGNYVNRCKQLLGASGLLPALLVSLGFTIIRDGGDHKELVARKTA